MMRSSDNGAKRHTGEDVSIVALSRVDPPAIQFYRVKRTSTGKYCTTLSTPKDTSAAANTAKISQQGLKLCNH